LADAQVTAQPAGISMFAPRLDFRFFSKHLTYSWGCVLLLTLCASSGCKPSEPIRTYTPPELERGSYEVDRMLVAIVPIGDSTWFFKLQGQDEPVYKQKVAFGDFLKSIRAPQPAGKDQASAEPTWTSPKDWTTRRPSNEMIYRSYQIPSGNDSPLTLEVSRLPTPESGVDDAFLHQNINRWCRQYSNEGISEKDVGDYSEKIELKDLTTGGGPAWLVNMSGLFVGRSGMGGPKNEMAEDDPHAGAGAAAERRSNPGQGGPAGDPHAGMNVNQKAGAASATESSRVKVITPPDWKPGKASSFIRREVSLTTADGLADISLMALPADANDLATNIARWRGQVGLGDLSPEELVKSTQKITVDGAEGHFVELVGDANTILGAMVKKGNEAWFFKMTAPNAVAAKEKAKFEEFVRTTKIQ
jgi:hypothetical protein